jgi:hypothetical protein
MGEARGQNDEGQSIGEADVRQVQGGTPARRRAHHLHEPEAQAAAGLGKVRTATFEVRNEELVFEDLDSWGDAAVRRLRTSNVELRT